jgi:restriction system protein
MDFADHALLNRPVLMLTVLKVASCGEVTLDDCFCRLCENLDRIGEPAPVGAQELCAHLDDIKRCLMEATLLVPTTGNCFALTKRGRDVLAEHPTGVDETVLMQFPEFREFIQRSARHPLSEDARCGQYDEGYEAYEEGLSFTDNPYPADTCDHDVWENGWFGARDEEAEHTRRS